MKGQRRAKNVLVISQTDDLARITASLLGDGAAVAAAGGREEAIRVIRQQRPALVILGPAGTAVEDAELCRELAAGWISRHSSIIVIGKDEDSEERRLACGEDFQVGSGEYDFLRGAAGPLLPQDVFLARFKELVERKLKERENVLESSIAAPGAFCAIWEQIPGLGAFELRQESVLENAEIAARKGKVCAISVTDNPGGNPAIANEVLSAEIKKKGIEPLVHVAFRDRSRNQCESLLYQLAAVDIRNLLILTGDYPSIRGFEGTSRPVFDLDSVTGLTMIAEMNRGMEHEIMRKKTRLAPTDFFCGVAFSPFKKEEGEVLGQYYKLQKKIEAGADFIITQVGYDARKLHELILWLRLNSYHTPVLISNYVLPLGTARAMHDNHVPGCVVTDALLDKIAQESAASDKGRAARLERAARLHAVARGLGMAGMSISGQDLPYDAVDYVLNRGEELSGNWLDYVKEFNFPQEDGFYLFERDQATGLNSERRAPRKQRADHSPVYYFSRAVHATIFEPDSPFFRPLQRIARSVDCSSAWSKAVGSMEYWSKAAIYGCQNCGDCALYDVAYLCPVSQCPKNQRNGPCGGSNEGWCEVYPGTRKCIWVRAYRRLKAEGREDTIGKGIVPPCNWELWQSSSWLNFYLGRDHLARKLGIAANQACEKPNR